MASEELTEKLAKALIEANGIDPNQMVQIGRPTLYGTPHGEAFGVNTEAAEPLWRSYMPAAKLALQMAREQLLGDPSMFAAEPLIPERANGAAHG